MSISKYISKRTTSAGFMMRNKCAESPIRIERAEQTLNGPAQLLDWRRNVKAIVDCGTLPPLYPSVCVGSTRTFPYDELLFRCSEILRSTLLSVIVHSTQKMETTRNFACEKKTNTFVK
ncbi:hypothetical protein ACLKA6_005676 [Drosophila palustris]